MEKIKEMTLKELNLFIRNELKDGQMIVVEFDTGECNGKESD